MSIFEDIKKDQIFYRKNKMVEEASILTTIIGDLQTQEKRGEVIDDKKVISFLKKNINTLKDNLAIYPEEKHHDILAEIALLEAKIPKQMTPEEIEDVLSKVEFSDIGQAMKFLSQNYAGLYNGKDAKNVILKMLE